MANTVIRWNPLRELAAMQNAMDRMFEDSWRNYNTTAHTLPLDIHEDKNSYTVIANVPGVDSEQINVTVHDGVLSIAVEIPQPEVEEGKRIHLQERFYGSLTRSFNLPQPINMEGVEASYDAGVLTLVLPKSEEAQPRQIPIKASNVLKSNN